MTPMEQISRVRVGLNDLRAVAINVDNEIHIVWFRAYQVLFAIEYEWCTRLHDEAEQLCWSQHLRPRRSLKEARSESGRILS